MGELYRLDFSNGKSYIGITTKTSIHRSRSSSTKGSDSILYHAWRKYGDPRLVVLAVVENKELASAETRAINVFNTFAPNGYNMTLGGDVSPLAEPLIAIKMKGNKNAVGSKHKRSSEYKKKLSNALIGNKNAVGNKHGIGNKNASGKRSPEAIANIKVGAALGRANKLQRIRAGE